MPPVLFIIWRRPEATKQVLAAIRGARPNVLYVACDGPRLNNSDDYTQVNATKSVIDLGIDWPCHVYRRYSEFNQGCKEGVSSAISWFFENVDEGIILEDDCLPHPTFFKYCGVLLEQYRNDQRVWCISGNNFQDGTWRGDASYYFSRQTLIWGWATWRRCWAHYDKELKSWEKFKSSGCLESVYPDEVERGHQESKWDRMRSAKALDTWDYQWHFTCVMNGGLTAIPNRNLVTNIGFDGHGMHCSGTTPDPGLGEGIDSVSHPSFVLPDPSADRYMFDHLFGGEALRKKGLLSTRLRNRVYGWRCRAINIIRSKVGNLTI
jgi:hypothetical protein